MTLVAPEQRAFFRTFPLPWGANTRLAQATGYANSTVGAWITGHNKMPREAFDLAVSILLENGALIPPEILRDVRATLQPSRKPIKGKGEMPDAPTRPAPVIPSTYEELEFLIRKAQLSDYQAMQLIRVLAS